jgi:predicted ABC-type ATPase
LAFTRVKKRVKEGGHDIPKNVISRRYERGLANFFNLYVPVVNSWIFINNSGEPYEVVAFGSLKKTEIMDSNLWYKLKNKYYGRKR